MFTCVSLPKALHSPATLPGHPFLSQTKMLVVKLLSIGTRSFGEPPLSLRTPLLMSRNTQLPLCLPHRPSPSRTVTFILCPCSSFFNVLLLALLQDHSLSYVTAQLRSHSPMESHPNLMLGFESPQHSYL